MTKIAREDLPSTIINTFLTLLRSKLSDVCSPARSNTNWIRSDIQYNKDKLNRSTSSKGKIHISKPKEHIGFPQVAVGDYDESNAHYVIPGKMETTGSITVRVVDNNAPQRIDSLCANISKVIQANKSTLITAGLSKITWNITPVNEYAFDDSTYNEKNIVISFTARTTDGC